MVSSMLHIPSLFPGLSLTNRHTLGGAMSEYLNSCLNKGSSDPAADLATFKAIENGSCLDPSQANSFPVPPRETGFNPVDGLPSTSLAGSGINAFPSNTAQFQERVHLDFTLNGMTDQPGQIDMSTYLTQMSMGNNNNPDDSNFNTGNGTNNYFPAGGNPHSNEAHISPLSYNNPLSSNSGNSSYASSRNFSGSSKTTPESTGPDLQPQSQAQAQAQAPYFSSAYQKQWEWAQQ